MATFFIDFFDKKFNFVILHKLTGQILLPDCVYFPCYSIICVSHFMVRQLTTSWHLNIQKVKIWLSRERKELSKWNEKHFSLFRTCCFRHTKQTIKNIADTTFKKGGWNPLMNYGWCFIVLHTLNFLSPVFSGISNINFSFFGLSNLSSFVFVFTTLIKKMFIFTYL